MQSRIVFVAVALLLWWASATTAAHARPVSFGASSVEYVERIDTVSNHATALPDDAAEGHQPSVDPAAQDDGDSGAADMPAVPTTAPAAPVASATMARPGPYIPAAWLAPHLGVLQRPPIATTVAG